jgi:pimeloyl-ACP methyl ester carboxylesterase
MMRWASLLLLAALGCSREEPTYDDGIGGAVASGGYGGVGAGGAGGSGGPSCPQATEVVHFVTDDGVTLEADEYTTGEAMAPAVVLLHMIPPANDRTNYPPGFIEALLAKKIRVLNVDRRGAGASGGVAEDAYLGPNGKLDAKAAFTFLTQGECGADPLRVGIVGASNGSTTALDYAVAAAQDSSLLFPSALVFLTGGTYTENQNKVSDHRDDLEPLPLLFVFSAAERDWSAALMPGAPSTWTFQEYDPGDHGTNMFSARPESIALVADYLADVL